MRVLAGLLAVLFLSAPLLAGCFSSSPTSDKSDVVASFYPLYFLSSRIAGPNLTVSSLVPEGTEPHEWQPAPRDVVRVSSARVFVYNGAGFEPWAHDLVTQAGNPELRVVDAAETVRGELLLVGEEEGEHEEGHDHHAEEGADPHFWLDPVLTQNVTGAIAAAFSAADPANAAHYEARAAALRADLQALHQEFETGLATCAKREIMVTHDAFSYLGHRYNFTLHAISGVSPESEPSAAKVREMADLARARGLKYIFFETLVSDHIARTIANEVGAETLVLNPVEGLTQEQAQAGKDYFSLMRDNLANLRTAMECPSS